MTLVLLRFWRSRAPGERRAWRLAAAALAGVVLVSLAGAAVQAIRPLRHDVALLRGQAQAMDQQARELAALRATPRPSVPGGALRDLVQSRIDGSTLGPGLASLDAPDPEHVVVVFREVAFADWLHWLQGLATLQVQLESCRVEALPATGTVAITATLVRTAPP